MAAYACRSMLPRLRAVADHLLPTQQQPAAAAVDRGGHGSGGIALPQLAPTHPDCDLRGCELSASDYLAHRLTIEERAHFLQRGYLLIRAGLGASEASELASVLDGTHELKLREDTARHEGAMPDVMNRMAVFTPANSMSRAPCVQWLLTCPRVFPKVVDILGWNISVYHAHANRSPPRVAGDVFRDGQFRPLAGLDPALRARPAAGEEPTFQFHQDTGRVNKELETGGLQPNSW